MNLRLHDNILTEIFFISITSLDHPDEMVDDEDDDVAEERDRVMSGEAEDDTLILHELTKVTMESKYSSIALNVW